MTKQLLTPELTRLKDFRYTDFQIESELSSVLKSLMEEENLSQYLNKLSEHIGSSDLKITASVFTKRYAFLTVLYLFTMSVYNKRLDVAFDNISLETNEEAEHWLPGFYFHNKNVEVCDGVNRENWRAESVKLLFADHINPLLTQISITTKISKLILWENVAIYIFWLYESAITKLEDEEIKKRALEDFDYLINQAPGDVFGDYHRNPLKRYYNEPQHVEQFQEKIRVRKTCCFTYLLEDNGGNCKTCPITCK